MSRLTLRQGWLLLLASMVWLVSGLARAGAPGEVTVSLRVAEQGDAPAIVCVVTKGKGRAQISMAPIAEGLLGLEKGKGWIPSKELPDIWTQLADAVPEADRKRYERITADVIVALFRMLPGNRDIPDELSKPQVSNDLVQSRDRVLANVRGLKAQQNAPVCSGTQAAEREDAAHCAASIAVREQRWHEHHVACAVTSRWEGEPKVLWLELLGRDGGATAAVDAVTLADGVLTLDTNLHGGGVDKHLVVLGGHYVPDSTVVARDEDVELVLQPLCAWRKLRFPRISLGGVKKEESGELIPEFIPELVLEAKRAEKAEKSKLSSECVKGGLADESVHVLLPRLEQGATLRATIEQKLPEGYVWEGYVWASPPTKGDNQLQFAASWRTRTVPETISMGATVLTFFWQREKCFYPHACPDASIHGLETQCKKSRVKTEEELEKEQAADPQGVKKGQGAQVEPSVDNGCYYRCKLDDDLGIGIGNAEGILDVPVTFTANDVSVDPKPEWSATIDRINAVVRDKTKSSDRYIKVDFAAWDDPWSPKRKQRRARKEQEQGCSEQEPPRVCDASQLEWSKEGFDRTIQAHSDALKRRSGARSDEIEGITLRDTQGRAHRIDFDLAPSAQDTGVHYAQLPGTTCGEGLDVDIRGERDYRHQPVVVEKGGVVLGHPMDAARWFYVGLGADLVAVRPIRPTSFFDSTRFRPGLVMSFVPRVKPRAARARSWRFDVGRIDMMLSDRPYQALSSEVDQISSRYESRRYYVRAMLGLVVRPPELELGEHVHLGLAPGLFLGTGVPLFQADRRYVGSFDMSLTPMMEGLLRLGRRLELRPSIRFICLEDFHRYSTDLHGRATDRTRVGAQCTMAVGGGIAVTL